MFDMGYFLLIIIMLLNIIFGIIIDTFADLRNIEEEKEKDKKEKCFICDQSAFDFNKYVKGVRQKNSPFPWGICNVCTAKTSVVVVRGLNTTVQLSMTCGCTSTMWCIYGLQVRAEVMHSIGLLSAFQMYSIHINILFERCRRCYFLMFAVLAFRPK